MTAFKLFNLIRGFLDRNQRKITVAFLAGAIALSFVTGGVSLGTLFHGIIYGILTPYLVHITVDFFLDFVILIFCFLAGISFIKGGILVGKNIFR